MDDLKFIDGKKFIWDGITHDNENEAQKVKAEYESNKFETRIIEEENKFYLFTRRVVTEVVVDK